MAYKYDIYPNYVFLRLVKHTRWIQHSLLVKAALLNYAQLQTLKPSSGLALLENH
jgi:hypothetical protein